MKSPPVLKKINGSYHRRLLPTEILQNGDVYSAGRDIGTSFIGKPANHSIAYSLETYLWRPMPQIEGYRQLDLSDDIDEQAKFVIITPQGYVTPPYVFSTHAPSTVREALKNIHRFSAIDDVLFYAKIEPKIATGHNPDNLTEEQVGTGYRLLLPSEIVSRPSTFEIEAWDKTSGGFGRHRWGMSGDSKSTTYRVRNGVKLAPAKAAPAGQASPNVNLAFTGEHLTRIQKLEDEVSSLKFLLDAQTRALSVLNKRTDNAATALKG